MPSIVTKAQFLASRALRGAGTPCRPAVLLQCDDNSHRTTEVVCPHCLHLSRRNHRRCLKVTPCALFDLKPATFHSLISVVLKAAPVRGWAGLATPLYRGRGRDPRDKDRPAQGLASVGLHRVKPTLTDRTPRLITMSFLTR